MTSIRESCYFPSLDKCLEGRHQLLSWKNAFTRISQLGGVLDDGALKQQLSEPETLRILSRPFSPYAEPTSKSKSSFDTKTSAINIPPSPHGRYDIKQLQDDTIWLANVTNIEEVAALRIVVVEWQTRPADQLLRGSLNNEISHLPIAGGNGELKRPSSILRSSNSRRDLAENAGDSISETQRERLLQIYLSERRYILKTCEYIISKCSLEVSPNEVVQTGSNFEGGSPDEPSWIEEIGGKILAVWNPDGLMEDGRQYFIQTAVNALQSRIDNMEKGSGWFPDEGFRVHLEIAWGKNQVIEMIHIMQIMLVLLGSSKKLVRAEILLSWFRFMTRYGFFEKFELPHDVTNDMYEFPLQSLVALVSFAILNVPVTLEIISQISTGALSTEISKHDSQYISNLAGVNEITEILMSVAASGLTNPCLAVLGWGIILHAVREYALASKDSRESRQSLQAANRFIGTDSFDFDGAEQSLAKHRQPLYRRSSTSSEISLQPSYLEEILDNLMDIISDEDPIGFLVKSAMDISHVFDVITSLAVDYCTVFGSDHFGGSGGKIRRMLLILIRNTLDWVEYQPTLLVATLAVLTGNERYWDTLDQPRDFANSEPAAFFLNDIIFMQKIFRTALARFPYETLPFFQLCRALAWSPSTETTDKVMPIIWPMIQTVDSLTCALPAGFEAYEIIEEDEEVNYVRLTSPLHYFEVSSIDTSMQLAKWNQVSQKAPTQSPFPGSQQLPIGTIGRVLSESKPLVVMWRYDYSVLGYAGKILQCASNPMSFPTTASNSTCSEEAVCEVIGLLTILISASDKQGSDADSQLEVLDVAQSVLENASDCLDRNQDVVSVIFEIFENELSRHAGISHEQVSRGLLLKCIQFIYALLRIMPDRVWPFLGRNNILGASNMESQLGAVIASSEVLISHQEFLFGCIRVYDSLINYAISHAVSYKVPTSAVNRFDSANGLGSKISQTLMEKVLVNFQRMMLDVFETVHNRKFASQEEMCEVNELICSISLKILRFCFAIDDQSDISQKILTPLAQSAQCLLEAFSSTSNSNPTVEALFRLLLDGAATPDNSLSIRGLQNWVSQTSAAICLTRALIRVNTMLGRSPSYLGEQLFQNVSVLTQLYAAHENYRLPVIDLFEVLVCSVDTIEKQPPSLLGHLGQDTASHFLELLSVGDKPLSDDDLAVGIWRFLSTIVCKRQQWFAVFVLTGNTPRSSLKKSDAADPRHIGSLFDIALDTLANIERLERMTAITMLRFVALAADNWPWVVTRIEEHSDFLTAITGFVQFPDLVLPYSNNSSNAISNDYFKLHMSSYILDILGIYIHHSQLPSNLSFAKKLLPSLFPLVKIATAVPAYNASLHANLRRNFESKYMGTSIMQLKRTSWNQPPLGRSFYYDLDLATKLLKFDPAWIGRHNQGFAEEMARANVNLSVVDSQVHLFRSWKFMAVELNRLLSSDVTFQKLMMESVTRCLQTNASSNLPETIFEGLATSRAELAFMLLETLIEAQTPEADIKNILPYAWDTVRTYEIDVGLALIGEGAEYYRVLLKILCLSLQVHTLSSALPYSETDRSGPKIVNTQRSSLASSTIANLTLEILGVIVARGFRSLTSVLHDDPSRLLPADFALIIAISHTALNVAGIGKHTTQMLSQFSDSQTARCASALLSWSDQIATDHDPIYGELSISFLLGISNVPALAEFLAVEGILTHISSTSVIGYLRRESGVGPFDKPTRFYSIWYRGILPLILNLLHAVGAPIAPEISSMLDSFTSQLKRASSNFANRPYSMKNVMNGSITWSMISEAQNLAIILAILDSFREAGSSVGIVPEQVVEPRWDRTQVKEDIEFWLQRRTALRARIMPTNETEESMVRLQPFSSTSAAENRLEEKVIEGMSKILSILDNREQ